MIKAICAGVATVVVPVINCVREFFKSRSDRTFDMQIKIKKDLFGIKVMFLQNLYVFAFLFCIAMGRTIFNTLSVPDVINFIWLLLAIVWGVLSTRRILMYKWICKELLGMCKEKFLIYITSISINLYSAIIIVFGDFGYNHLYNLLLLLNLIVMIALQFLEAICLDIHYLEYEHSEVTINCKDGRSVTCENILNINKKRIT